MASDIERYLKATYFRMRVGMASLAFAFPVVLTVGGTLGGIPIQRSLSAYYFASEVSYLDCPSGLMRNAFVGLLLSIGLLLILYQGYTAIEDVLLTYSGVMAVGIATTPMGWRDCCHNYGELQGDLFALLVLCLFILIANGIYEFTNAKGGTNWYAVAGNVMPLLSLFITQLFVWWSSNRQNTNVAHTIFAIQFFLVLVAIIATSWLKSNRKFGMWYIAIAVTMAVLFATELVLSTVSEYLYLVLHVEWTGIYTFAAYWVVKTFEISSLKTE